MAQVRERLLRWLYSVTWVLLTPILFIFLRNKEKSLRQRTKRELLPSLGWTRTKAKQGGYLIHCASVGEVVCASPLINRLLEQEPQVPITVTTSTASGADRVKTLFADSVVHYYLPFDLFFAMRGFLAALRPKMVLITEVELWPNFIHACHKQRVPCIVINARMTERSANKYRRFKHLFLPMLKKISLVCAQGQRDFEQYLGLGIEPTKLMLTGNMKFDQKIDSGTSSLDAHYQRLEDSNRTIVVAGSTHAPEEQLVIDAYKQVLEFTKAVSLIIVPRHPQRFEEVSAIIDSSGLQWRRFSQELIDEDVPQILLVDAMGKLNQAYQIADIAFVGGSIANRGGHNALEPIAAKVPVIMGPSQHNNPAICQQLKDVSALRLVNNSLEIADNIKQWIEHPKDAKQSAECGYNLIENNRGAVSNTLVHIRKVLDKKV